MMAVFVISAFRTKGSKISRERLAAPTGEALFVIKIKVSTAATSTHFGRLSIRLRSDQTFDMTDNQLEQDAESKMRGRDGTTEVENRVYFQRDSVVGYLPYATTASLFPRAVSTEIFNTARLSGRSIEVPIVVEGITRRGNGSGWVRSVWNVVTMGLRHSRTKSNTRRPHSPG